jgi:hypothetical protein
MTGCAFRSCGAPFQTGSESVWGSSTMVVVGVLAHIPIICNSDSSKLRESTLCLAEDWEEQIMASSSAPPGLMHIMRCRTSSIS